MSDVLWSVAKEVKVLQHTGDIGDCIASLPSIRSMGGGHIVICPPYGKLHGRESMKGARFEALRPLLAAQSYVESAEWSDAPVETKYDFSGFRHDHIHGENLAEWQARHMGVQISTEPWLTVTPQPGLTERIIVSRSSRYQSWQFPWQRIVAEHRARLLFVGLPDEHKAFCRLLGLVEYLPTLDLLELAQVIAGSALFIGNQSAPCWIALGLGHPLIQEQYASSPDSVIPRANAQYCLSTAMPRIGFPPAASSISLTPSKKATKPLGTVLAVFPFCQSDKEQAKRLAEYIRDLGGVEEHPCLIVHPQGVDTDGIEGPLREAFASVEVFNYPATLSGWPFGPNEMFAQAAMLIDWDSRFGDFLWLEPDCVPRFSWLRTIEASYRLCGQPIMGVVTDTVNLDTRQIAGRHTVGVAVYPKNFAQLCPLVKNVAAMSAAYQRANAMPKAFDAYFGPYTASRTAETKLIQHFWRSKEFTNESGVIGGRIYGGAFKTVDPDAVLLHGCKGGSLLELVRGKKEDWSDLSYVTGGTFPNGMGEVIAPTPDPAYETASHEYQNGVFVPRAAVNEMQGGAVVARLAHNQKVASSNLAPATPSRGKKNAPIIPPTWGEDGLPAPPFVKGQPEFLRFNELIIEGLNSSYAVMRKYARNNLRIKFGFKGIARDDLYNAIILKEREIGGKTWKELLARFAAKGGTVQRRPMEQPTAPQAAQQPGHWNQVKPIETTELSESMREKMLAMRKERGMAVTA